MTYYEFYKQCKTFKELEAAVKEDVLYAMMANRDRLKIIQEAAEKVCNENGWLKTNIIAGKCDAK